MSDEKDYYASNPSTGSASGGWEVGLSLPEVLKEQRKRYKDATTEKPAEHDVIIHITP